jgi:hypothetical protein
MDPKHFFYRYKTVVHVFLFVRSLSGKLMK